MYPAEGLCCCITRKVIVLLMAAEDALLNPAVKGQQRLEIATVCALSDALYDYSIGNHKE
jgi:hypothetical protein